MLPDGLTKPNGCLEKTLKNFLCGRLLHCTVDEPEYTMFNRQLGSVAPIEKERNV